ncbi:MAG: AarF/UbiB family protein [Oligoflexales bacterium]
MIKPQVLVSNSITNTVKFLNYRLTNKEKSIKFLKEWLGSFPGISTKISQFIGDKLEEDSLSSNNGTTIYEIPYEEVLDLIHTQIPQLIGVIKNLDRKAHSASVGQVHKLELKNGVEYAVKIQYPGIAKVIDQQINKLFKFYKFIPFFHKKNFEAENYRNLFEELLKSEIDYVREAKKQKIFFDHFNNHYTRAIVPKIYTANCNKTILLQDWVEGISVDSFVLKDKSEKIKAASNLITVFFEMLFGLRCFQTDFNFGNISFKLNTAGKFDAIILYDFGATLVLDDNHAAVMWSFLKNVVEEETLSPFDYLISLGFDGSKLKYIAHLLPAVISLLLEPFSADRPYKISEWNLKERLNSILGEDRWWFRAAGPPWFFIFLKAVNGLFMLLEKLNVSINFYQIYKNFKSRSCYTDKVKVLVKKDQYIQFDVKNYTSKDFSKYLNIKLIENNREKVDLQMPCRVVDMIEELIPEKYLGIIEEKGIEFSELKRKVQRSGYVKQILIEEKYEDQKLKIWIS